MAEQKRKYDSTVARIAGNILSGYSAPIWIDNEGRAELTTGDIDAVIRAVAMARSIVEEVIATEPE